MTDTIQTAPAITFAGRNGTFPIGPSPGIKDLWVKLMEDFGKIEGQVDFRSYGICHAFDGRGQMDYLAAVAVSNAGAVPGYLYTLIIPTRKEAVFIHQGKMEFLPQTWAKIFDTWLPEQKLEVAAGPQFEVYSEDFDGDAGTGSVEIHIPVK
jgi:AraC family transcriptional regulator